MPLYWTTEKPTREGWYWIRHPELSARVVKVHFTGPNINGRAYMTHDYMHHGWCTGKEIIFEYAGPVPEPTVHPTARSRGLKFLWNFLK